MSRRPNLEALHLEELHLRALQRILRISLLGAISARAQCSGASGRRLG